MNRFEYKNRFDPEMGMYVKKHIYGEGMFDVFKSIGSKLFGKTVKNTLKSGIQKGAEEAIKKQLLSLVIMWQKNQVIKLLNY